MIRAVLAMAAATAATPSTVIAQTVAPPVPTEDFRSIVAAHQQLSRYDLQIDVTYGGDVVPLLHANVRCFVADRCLRTVGALTVLKTPQWLIVIDSSKHTMTIAEHIESMPVAPSTQSPDQFLNAWLSTGAKLSGGELTETGRHWTFAPGDPRLPQGEFYTDPATHLLRRIIYPVAEGESSPGRISITYTWRNSSQMDPADFDESHYFLKQNQIVSPTGNYADYKLIRANGH